MKVLMILNDPPYGNERSYNGLRLAKALVKQENDVTLFLMSDSVECAKKGQRVPTGFYNIELMLDAIARNGDVLLCGTCMDARGLMDDELHEGTKRSTMQTLAEKTKEADKVLVF